MRRVAALPALAALMALTMAACGETTTTTDGALAPTSPATSTMPSPAETASPSPSDEAPEESPETSPTPDETTTKPAQRGTRIKVAGSSFGPMLYDATGQAIYLFDKERTSRSECYGACAEAWPPVFTKGKPVAIQGAKPSLLDTTRRSDGRMQVTYAGHPLYFYAHEGKNQVLCHDVEGFGGLWLVVQPNGDPAP